VGKIGLADRTGLHPVGHLLPLVVAAGDPVHVQDNSPVDLEASDGSALITDCHVVVAAFYDDQGTD
jgi:hypothetical protein